MTIEQAIEQDPCEDAISRQAALGCCRNEWEEEVEMRLKSLPPVTPQPKYEDIAKAFQFGLAFGFGEKHDEMNKVIDEIKKVITPQPKTGHWIISDDGLYRPICDKCGAHPWKGYIPTVEEATEVFKYCPKCGSYNGGEQDG